MNNNGLICPVSFKVLCVEMETLDSQKEMKEWNKHGAVTCLLP